MTLPIVAEKHQAIDQLEEILTTMDNDTLRYLLLPGELVIERRRIKERIQGIRSEIEATTRQACRGHRFRYA